MNPLTRLVAAVLAGSLPSMPVAAQENPAPISVLVAKKIITMAPG